MNGLLESLFDLLVYSNLRAVILVTVAFGLLAAFRTQAGSFRHVVWLTVVAGCLSFPLVSAVVPSVAIPILPAPVASSTSADRTGAASLAESQFSTAAETELSSGVPWLIAVWGIGVLTLGGKFALSIVRLSRAERGMRQCQDRQLIEFVNSLRAELELRRPVCLLESETAGSPYTWGSWRPRIVLPVASQEWSQQQMANVLRHEMCHIKRFDWARLCLQQLATAVYWFNPLVWIAVRQCRFEAERACDDFVIRSGGRTADYAEQLVELMASSRRQPPFAVALGDGDFVRRIRAILSSTREVSVMSDVKGKIAAVSVALSVIVLAACQVTNGQAVSDGPPVPSPAQTFAQSVQQEQQGQQGQQAEPRQVVQLVPQRALPVRRAPEGDEAMARSLAELAMLEQQLRALPLDRQREQLLVMNQALEMQQVALRESQQQLQRQERVLQELNASLNRQAEMLVQREREMAARQRALAEAEVRSAVPTVE